MRTILMMCAVIVGSCSPAPPPSTASFPESAPLRVLVLTKTAGFRHDSIPAGIQALRELANQHGWDVLATEESQSIVHAIANRADVIVFLNTSGNILNEEQKAALQTHIHRGGGFVGIHAASDTEHDWPWYGQLLGARFASHPHIQPAEIRVVDRQHPSSSRLPEVWNRTDEWYNFDSHPRMRIGDAFQLIAQLNEQSYQGGSMGTDHPWTWCHEFEGGRVWYTAGGHTIESFSETEFLLHIAGGITWAARRE